MRWTSAIFLLLVAVRGLPKGNDTISSPAGTIAFAYSLNVIDLFPSQLGISYNLSNRISGNALLGHVWYTNNSLNNQVTYFLVVTKGGNYNTEAARMKAGTCIMGSNYLKLSMHYTITPPRRNRLFLNVGIVYTLAKTTQQLTLDWSQNYYGTYKDAYKRENFHHIAGLAVTAHKPIHGGLHLMFGVEYFEALDDRGLFDDIVSNYSSGNYYTPGQGFSIPFLGGIKVPLSLNIGFEYRLEPRTSK
jgi:hypothetical protein